MNTLYKNIKENIFHICALGLIPIVSGLYFVTNNPRNGAQLLVTTIDSFIPFIKEFIIVYILWYPFIVLTLIYLCIKDKKVYYRTLMSIIIGMLASFVIFYIFQTYVPRPELQENDVFSKLVSIIYASDKPYNCFPSLHVLESYLMMKGVRALDTRNKKIIAVVDITAIAIILSTQFVKQHVVMDIVGGIYVAEVIFNLIPGLKRVILMFYRSCKRRLEYLSENI